ncbi:hypothetical protein V2J09_016107 [Rumex salicifolius]
MADIELEEGEACTYQYDEETNIDLNALTYIDEKLQNVLGHLKKDFEGGVTSENLGAKYGGYGSFLNQPSPVWSSRSLANVQDNHHKSAACLSAKDSNSISLSRPSGNHSTKLGPGCARAASSDLYKTPSEHDSEIQIARAPVNNSTGESTAKLEVLHKSNNMYEQKTLKLRIKVGSDNLSARKNPSIYSGLGLVSPSSSFGDSPIGIEGLTQGFQPPGDESPTHIIRIMTSIPIYGGHLLSPLPEGLARLTDKLLRANKVQSALKHKRDTSVLESNQKTDKILVEDSLKTEERDHVSPKHKEATEKSLNNVNIILRNQADLSTEACEGLVSEALKLPLLSDLHGSRLGMGGTSKQKSNFLPNLTGHQSFMPVLSLDGKRDERQIGEESLAGKVADEEKVDSQANGPSYCKKDGGNGREAANSSGNTNANDFGPKSRKGSISEVISSQKRKNGKKYATVQQEGEKLLSRREKLFSGDKRKHKGSQLMGTEAITNREESVRQTVSGNKDNCTATGTFPKQEDTSKARDKYKDFCGDTTIEVRDNLMDSPNEPSNGRLRNSQNSDQVLPLCNNHFRERSDDGTHEQLISKVISKRALSFAPSSGHVPPIGAPAPAGAPVNNWVQCDKCLKWRLLPFGTQVDSLPDNWLCSMLNWLPGMNNCNITQEETTKAVTELYQPQNMIARHDSLSIFSGVTAPSDMHLSQTRQDIFLGGRNKYHGLEELQNSKQELLLSVKSTSFSNTLEYDVKNELHCQHSGHATNSVPEANQHKKKSKKKKHNSFPDGGHSMATRLGGQREPYQDYPRPKKIKTEDEDLMSTHDVGNEMLMHDSSNEMLTSGADKVQPLPHSGLDTRNSNDDNVDTKKRKVKSSVDSVCPSILSDDMVHESEQMRQKMARKSSKNHRVGKDVGSTFILDDGRSLKRESGSGAASGSSKVIDSQRSKFSLHEIKSSPVKSLSLSPFSTSNLDMYALGKKIPPRQDYSHTAGILTKNGSADIEDYNGGDKCAPMRKNLCGNNDHQSFHSLKDQIDDSVVDDKVEIKHSLDPFSHTLASSQNGTFDKHNACTFESPSDDGFLNDPVKSVCNDQANGSFPKQSAAKVSSLFKDTNQIHKPKSDKSKAKICESYDDLQGHPNTLNDKTEDIKFQQKSECDAGELDFGGRKKPSGIMLDSATKDNSKQKSVRQEDSTFKADSKKQVKIDCGEKVSKSVGQVKTEEMEFLSGKEKSGNKGDLSNHVSLPDQGNGADASCASVRDRGKGLQEHSSTKIPDIQNGPHSSKSKHQLSNVHKLKDQDTLSPMRRDSHNQAASNALKEAKDLKHLADRKKNSGSAESTGLYFEAALKFLHGACVLESSGSRNSIRGDIIHSMQVYSSTAKLCEFCAHEYEKSKDLASASLAYKCMEVAYLRVIYSSHPAASRDRHELQTSLQIVPPGESPSSSASDIDNASNPATAEKTVQARDGNSPQPAGNHVIAARNRPIFSRLLNFMQDVNSAMEASRKSQGAFAAAKATLKQADSKEGINTVKRVLDFNFHDVNRLLHLVRLAMEAIKH